MATFPGPKARASVNWAERWGFELHTKGVGGCGLPRLGRGKGVVHHTWPDLGLCWRGAGPVDTSVPCVILTDTLINKFSICNLLLFSFFSIIVDEL